MNELIFGLLTCLTYQQTFGNFKLEISKRFLILQIGELIHALQSKLNQYASHII